MVERRLYCLARVDDNGNVLRQATEDDLKRLGVQLDQLSTKNNKGSPAKQDSTQQATFMQFVMNGNAWCRNCGAQSSPQWRKGPPPFAVLCNACGTRYRRTQALQRETPLPTRAMAVKYYQEQMLELQQQISASSFSSKEDTHTDGSG